MRVVFDTNALVSALLFERSAPGQAFFAAMDAGEEILLSAALVSEIHEVLQRRKFERYVSAEQCEEFLIALVQSGGWLILQRPLWFAAIQRTTISLSWQLAAARSILLQGILICWL